MHPHAMYQFASLCITPYQRRIVAAFSARKRVRASSRRMAQLLCPASDAQRLRGHIHAKPNLRLCDCKARKCHPPQVTSTYNKADPMFHGLRSSFV
ncbi:hypothetical protein TcWFU_002908 [Taenia crassiceps]|uniref:Uncharacterized protein n=1 Tax=Taenia crassiceps TaxID=6207 RepID=A0ABR4Q3K9_9CEST